MMFKNKALIYFVFISSLFSKDIIAVLDLESIGLSSGEAKMLTQRLTTKLISLDKYQLVERNNMDKILKEQKFQNSGCTDSECAVEIGQLLNTDFIVMGNVNKFGSTWILDARLIDVGLGTGILSAEFTMQGEIDGLITTGITSIAKQLCEMETIKESSKTESTQSNVNGKSFVNNKELNNKRISLVDNIIEEDLSDKTWSFSVGLSTNRNFNLFQLTKDFKLTDNISVYSYLGLGNIFGIGLCNQSNYNKTGFISAISYGVALGGFGTTSLSIAKQWKKKDKNRFFSFGVFLENSSHETETWAYSSSNSNIEVDEIAVEYHEKLIIEVENRTLAWLVLGYDWRF